MLLIHLSRDGVQQGPFTLQDLQKKAADGDLLETDLVWYDGCSSWVKARSIPGVLDRPEKEALDIATEPLPATTVTPDVPNPQIRPWVRYWARMIDLSIFNLSLGMLIAVLTPGMVPGLSNQYFGFVSLAAYMLLEPLLMSSIGVTPGKWLLRIRVRDGEGNVLSTAAAYKRSFQVWMLGLAGGLPLLSLATMVFSFNRLKQNGKTIWDDNGAFQVIHEPIGKARLIGAFAYFAIIIGFAILGFMVMQENPDLLPER